MNKFHDIKIPENINEITNMAVLRGEKYMKRKAKKSRKIVIAASLSLVCILGLSIPVMAEKIPFVGNVFEHLNKDNGISDKLFFLKGKQYKYAQAVNQEIKDNGVSMTIKEVVCDGANIFISYIVKSDKPFQNTDWTVLPIKEKTIKSDFYNEKIPTDGLNGLEGKYVDDYTFIGMDKIDLFPVISKGVDIPDKFSLDIVIDSIDDKSNNDYKRIKGQWKFKLDVSTNSKDSKIIESNVGNNELKVNKVVLTPMSTDISVTVSKNSPRSTYVIVYEENGNILKGSHGQVINENGAEKVEITKYSPVSEGAKFIIVKFVDKSKEELPVLGEFKIPIE